MPRQAAWYRTTVDYARETMTEENTPPCAASNAYSIAPSGVLRVSAALGLLKNDFDPDMEPLRISLERISFGKSKLALNTATGAFTFRAGHFLSSKGFLGSKTKTLRKRGQKPITLTLSLSYSAFRRANHVTIRVRRRCGRARASGTPASGIAGRSTPGAAPAPPLQDISRTR